jgi:hypothetical protein
LSAVLNLLKSSGLAVVFSPVYFKCAE